MLEGWLKGKEGLHELSGGEVQRGYCARIREPSPDHPADEPTGNLDPTTSVGIMEVLMLSTVPGQQLWLHNEEVVNSMRRRVAGTHTGKSCVMSEGVILRLFPDKETEAQASSGQGQPG